MILIINVIDKQSKQPVLSPLGADYYSNGSSNVQY